MDNAATQQGADASIEDRISSLLDSEESIEESAAPEPPEENEEESQDIPEDVPEDEQEQEAPDADDATPEGEELSLDDLSKYLGVDSDRLDTDEEGNLYVKTKIDGKEGKATLADLVKSYQLEGSLTKKHMEASEHQKALEQQKAQLEQQAQARIQQLDDLANIAMHELNQEFQSVDWNTLRQEDPAEFSARKAEFQDRQNRINQLYQQVQTDRQKEVTEQQERIKQLVAEEGQKLSSAIPEWSDSTIATQERNAIRDFAKSLGYGDDDLNSVVDHRQVVVLRKAMLYDKIMAQKTSVSKKVKTLPKVQKPGSAKSKAEILAAKHEQKYAKLKKTGDFRDAAEILKDLL